MNEELLKHLYSKYNLVSKGSLDTFISDMKNEETARGFHSKYLSDKGDFNTFKSDLYTSPNNTTQNTTPTITALPTQSSTSGAIDHGKVKDYIGSVESDSTYTAANKNTSARGKFQHMWSEHGSQIAQVTGIKDEATYLKSPEAQEKYQDYLQPMYEKQLPKIRKVAIEQGKDYSDEELMYLIHHSWIGNAEKFLKGQDVPDKEGLETAIAKGRERGLTAPRSVTNKLIEENTDFVQVTGDVLPTRGNKAFNSPVDKRIVDKLSGFMQDHGLVVTDTNDTKIHKSKAQNTGKSLDINFNDKKIDGPSVKNAVLDAQRRGLKLVYEIKDKRVYDAFVKGNPDLSVHTMYNPEASGNHFSVYHADNLDYDKNLLESSKGIPKERLIEVRSVKARIVAAARKASPKEVLDELRKKPTVDPTTLMIGQGATRLLNAGKKALFSEEEQYRKAAAYMFQTGQLNASDFTDEELAEIWNSKAEIADLYKQSTNAKKRLKDQLEDKGFLEGVGDFFAGSITDQVLGGISGGAADRLDTKDGKININYKDRDFGGGATYLTPEQILNLKWHPSAANPKDANDPKNKELRGIQKILVAGDTLEYDAKTHAQKLRRELSGTRLNELEKEINKIGGKETLKKLEVLTKKEQEQTISDTEKQQLESLKQKLEDNGQLLTQFSNQAQQYNIANDEIKAISGKYGNAVKIRLLKDEDQANYDALEKRMNWVDKIDRSITNMVSSFANGVFDMPGATINAVGGIAEAATGTDMGFTNAAKVRGQVKVDQVSSTRDQRGIMESSMEVDGHTAVFKNNKVDAIYDADGYKVENDAIASKAQELLEKDYKGKQSELSWLNNTSFNFNSLLKGVEDNMPQLAEIALVGGFGKAIAGAATKAIATSATSGSRVANIARTLTKPLSTARGLESTAMIPVFIKDTVDQAIADGAITPGQIYGTASVNLIREALAESMFAGPLGKMLSGKGITKSVFSRSLDDKLVDVVKHYATGKITAGDFMNHLGRSTAELLKGAGGEFIEEGMIELTTGITNEFLNTTLGTNYDEDTATGKEIFSAGLVGMGAGSVMGGVSMVSNIVDYKSGIADSYKTLLSEVVGQTSSSLVKGESVANPEAFKEYLSAAVENGEIDQKDADKYSTAIQTAANRTKFTNDIDVSTGTFKDLRDKRGIDSRERFISLARNTAFNSALTETIEPANQFEKLEQVAKVNSYENILKELELNAHKTIYSSATPTSIGLQRNLNSSQVSALRLKHAAILDEVNGTKLNAENKAKAVELKLNQAANTILRSKEDLTSKEEAELNKIDGEIADLETSVKTKNEEDEAEAAVATGHGTPEQIALQTKIQTKTVEDWFDAYAPVTVDGNVTLDDTAIERLREDNPLAVDLIDERVAKLKGIEYVKKAKNLKKDVDTSPSTKKSGLEGRYEGKPDMKTLEEEVFTRGFIEDLKEQLSNLDETSPSYPYDAQDIQDTIDEFTNLQKENNTENSYEKKYANTRFKDYVDKKTSKKSDPVDYVQPEEEFNADDLSPEDFEFDDDPDTPKPTETNINIVDTSSADIIAELNKLATPQEKLEWLKQNNLITPIVIDGKSYNAIDYSDRIMVLAKIGKYNIPFYISTGQAGKKNVKAGDWYVVFGIGESGWINKGSEENINSQYDFPVFQKIAKILNEGVGSFESRENSGNGKIKDFIGYLNDNVDSLDDFNSQMNLPITPAKNHTDSKTFYENVNTVLDLVNNELITITNNKQKDTAPDATPVITPEQQESINKINKLIEDGKNATLVEETAEKQSHYTLAGKLYQRVTQFFGNMVYDAKSTITNLFNAVVVGNYFDTFARMYYANPNLTIEEFTTELEKKSDYTQLSKIEIAKLFDDSKQRLLEIKNQIQKDLKDDNLVFITDNIFVHTAFKNGEWDGVAGTLDMVVVDSKGKIHIYDFKTKADNNAKFPVTKKSLSENVFGESIQEKWTKQQTAYSRVLKDTFGYTPSINIIVIPVSYKTEAFTGDFKNSEDVKAFKPTPYDVAFTKTRPFIFNLIFDKNNKLVVALDTVHDVPPAPIPPIIPPIDIKNDVSVNTSNSGGVVNVSANGYKALSIKDNLIVSDYLRKGDPAFYELEGSVNESGVPRIDMVVYYNPNTKRFQHPEKGVTERIIIGRNFKKEYSDLPVRFAKEIKASKDGRVETRVEGAPILNKRNFIAANKVKLTPEDVKALLPDMYVIGKSYASDEAMTLLAKEVDKSHAEYVQDFLNVYRRKNPGVSVKAIKQIQDILEKPVNNGKVAWIKKDQVILFDTITNAEYAPGKALIEAAVEKLSVGAKGEASWRVRVEDQPLNQTVSKRAGTVDYSSEKPNFRGRLIEFFSGGPSYRNKEQNKPEAEQEIIYKIEYIEPTDTTELAKSVEIPVTKKQAMDELLAIRVQISHSQLRTNREDADFIQKLSDVLRVPAEFEVKEEDAKFAQVYNVVPLTPVTRDGSQAPVQPAAPKQPEPPAEQPAKNEGIKVSDIPKVSPDDRKTSSETTLKDLIGDEDYGDLKTSEQDLSGRVEVAVAYIKSRFEELNVEIDDQVLNNLVKGTSKEGSKVWGAFHNSMVTLASNASEIVGRHESIHVAEIMFHTEPQIKAFRQEALARYGKELGISKTNVEDLTDKELRDVREALATEFEDYKNTLLLPQGFSKSYPTIAKFIEKLFNFLKKNYLIGKSYITNNKSIDQLFYEVENNILGRDFIGRRKKNVRDTFQEALDNLTSTDFKISNWGTKEVYKFADFIATDLFTKFLQKKYSNLSSINEVLGKHKDKNANILYSEFRKELKNTIEQYKADKAITKKLEVGSEKYNAFSDLLDDIYNQYNGEKLNKDFKFIVDKQLAKRYIKGGTYDEVDEDSLVKEQDDNEKDTKDTSEENQLEAWQTKQGKVDAKTKSSARLREFFSSFPLRARTIKDGKSQRTTITDSLIFNDLYYKGEWIHNKLLVELSDNSNYQDFITGINNLVPKYQFAGDLIAAVMNLKEGPLMEAYDNNKLRLPLDLVENPEKYDFNMWILKDMYQAIADQTNLNPLKVLTSNKGKQVVETQVVKSIKNTDYENALRSLKETIEEKLIDEDKKENIKVLLSTAIDAIESKGRTAGIIKELFSEIGYEASNELILHLQPTVNAGGDFDNLTELSIALEKILNRISKNTLIFDDNDAGLTQLATFISTYSTVSSGLSYQNVENENEFAHKNSNYLTRVQAIWNKGVERKKQWVDNMMMDNGQPILGHYRNPFYTDFLNKKVLYKIVVDGFIQTKDQSNSGKAYADYNKAEIIASSINAFLAKNNEKKEANTIDSKAKDGTDLIEHALYHIQVYSDSPQRWFLQAPVFKLKEISSKLTQLVYGEIERIHYTKQGDMAAFEKMSKAGSVFQNIPELNDITFTTPDGVTIPFIDLFTLGNWSDFNPNTLLPNLNTMKYLSKSGEYVTVKVPGTTYEELLNAIIAATLADNKLNFLEFLGQEGVYNMIPPLQTGDVVDDVSNVTTTEDLDNFYYNSYYNNVISQNVFGGDPANYKLNPTDSKTDIDIVKRTKQEISPNIKKLFKKPTFNVIVIKDIELETPYFQKKNKKTGELVNVKANTTDAGAYHTLKRRREIMEADANWDLIGGEMGEIFDRIENGTYTKEDLQALDLQPLKPFVYTQVIQKIKTKKPDGTPGVAAIRVPVQLKDAEHVLLPTEAFAVDGEEMYVRPRSLADIENGNYIRPDLAKLLYLMETQGVDLAVFESGSKAEIFNKVDIDNTDENNTKESIVTLNNSDWGVQQEVPRKDMEAKVGQGSQEHKIMSANVDTDWSFKYNGKVYTGPEGANELLQSIQETNANVNLKKALKKIQNKDGSLNIDKVLDILKEGIIEKNSNLESLEGLVLQDDGKTLIPVELLGKKGQQILNSILKKVPTFKVKGAALVNKPGFGYMGNRNKPNTFSDDLQLITEKDKDGSTRIKHWEAVVPVYDPIIYDYIDIHGNLLLDENKKPLIPEKLLQAFFYRIPTEDKYSMFPIRIKRFSMPAQGGGIILPREATETAGLDFDVDKLYGYYYNFKVNTPPSDINAFKNYVLKNVAEEEQELKSKYIDAIYGGYMDDIDMLDFYELTADDIPFIKNYSVSLHKYEKEYLRDNPTASFTKEISLYDSNLDTPQGTQNLKLDVYFSLTQTKAYGRDALKPGNKDRLVTMRNTALANSKKPNYSYADPVHVTNNATKNIVGKRLIGIFANANSFYNLIQGVTKIGLRKPLYFKAGSQKYYFTSLAEVNPQISKNIAELLFASTEDVKDPVLEPLNINEITSPLLVTLLSLTGEGGDKIINFEDAVAVLSDPEIIDAVKKVQKNGGRLKDAYVGEAYTKLLEVSDAYNAIISAAKIDQELGPDFYTIKSKLDSIDSIFDATVSLKYPLATTDIYTILPSKGLDSEIKQLNVYRSALQKELAMFSNVYSFLTPPVERILDKITSVSKNKKLNPKLLQKYSYMVYDAAIQNYLNSTDQLEELKNNFPAKLKNYTFPAGSGILQQAFETKKNVSKMRWVNISASDILTQYQNAFTDLFRSDPDFATELATYAFLTGTNFSMDSIVKIVPNVFYYTTQGKVIRGIINGNILEKHLKNDSADAVLYNNFVSITNELKEPDKLKSGKFTNNTQGEDLYVHIREKTANILLTLDEYGDYYIVHKQIKGELPNYIINSFGDLENISTDNTDNDITEPEFNEEGDYFGDFGDPDAAPSTLGDPDSIDNALDDEGLSSCTKNETIL